MDIQKLNCLTPDNAATPKYNPYSGKSCVQVYYANNNKVIIVGVADNNYIYWLSVSKMDDIETNRSIFDYIYRLTPTVFGSISRVLESQTHYSYEQLTSFYSATLTQAEAILPHYRKIKELCKAREADGRYIDIMRYYLNILQCRSSDPVSDYEKNERIIELIRSEKYLRISDNSTVRNLYSELEKHCSNLYNAYITAVR